MSLNCKTIYQYIVNIKQYTIDTLIMIRKLDRDLFGAWKLKSVLLALLGSDSQLWKTLRGWRMTNMTILVSGPSFVNSHSKLVVLSSGGNNLIKSGFWFMETNRSSSSRYLQFHIQGKCSLFISLIAGALYVSPFSKLNFSTTRSKTADEAAMSLSSAINLIRSMQTF